MNCRQVTSLLPDLVEGELSAVLAAEANDHIGGCPHCASELQDYRKALGALSRSWEMVEAPHALAHFACPQRNTRWSRARTLIWAPAAIAVIFMVVLSLSNWMSSQQPSVQTAIKHTAISQTPSAPHVTKPALQAYHASTAPAAERLSQRYPAMRIAARKTRCLNHRWQRAASWVLKTAHSDGPPAMAKSDSEPEAPQDEGVVRTLVVQESAIVPVVTETEGGERRVSLVTTTKDSEVRVWNSGKSM
jgi:hypothetical protein